MTFFEGYQVRFYAVATYDFSLIGQFPQIHSS